MATVEDEQELWDRLRQGDTEAFGSFYRQHAMCLQSFLRRCLSDAKGAEDVAQEAFLQLWRHPNGFNPARATKRASRNIERLHFESGLLSYRPGISNE